MLEIVKGYKDEATRLKYLSACERFRYPYWDPCTPRQTAVERNRINGRPNEFGIPLIVSRKTVYVRRPETPEKLEEIPNPLHQYKFPKQVQSQGEKEGDFFWTGLAETHDGKEVNVRYHPRYLAFEYA